VSDLMNPSSPVVRLTSISEKSARLTLSRAVSRGSIGFALVSLGGFAVWAFGGRWFAARLGEGGMYAVCAIVFLGLSGLFLHPLVQGPRALWRFYKAFVPAFVAYAVVWSMAWFTMGFGAGEWIGSVLGTIVFAALVARSLGSYRSFIVVCVVLFVTHSFGYFIGGELYYWSHKPAAADLLGSLSRWQRTVGGRMAWGLLYGLGFGAGMGYAFFQFQVPKQQV
jgi:hypothetical protein